MADPPVPVPSEAVVEALMALADESLAESRRSMLAGVGDDAEAAPPEATRRGRSSAHVLAAVKCLEAAARTAEEAGDLGGEALARCKLGETLLAHADNLDHAMENLARADSIATADLPASAPQRQLLICRTTFAMVDAWLRAASRGVASLGPRGKAKHDLKRGQAAAEAVGDASWIRSFASLAAALAFAADPTDATGAAAGGLKSPVAPSRGMHEGMAQVRTALAAATRKPEDNTGGDLGPVVVDHDGALYFALVGAQAALGGFGSGPQTQAAMLETNATASGGRRLPDFAGADRMLTTARGVLDGAVEAVEAALGAARLEGDDDAEEAAEEAGARLAHWRALLELFGLVREIGSDASGPSDRLARLAAFEAALAPLNLEAGGPSGNLPWDDLPLSRWMATPTHVRALTHYLAALVYAPVTGHFKAARTNTEAGVALVTERRSFLESIAKEGGAIGHVDSLELEALTLLFFSLSTLSIDISLGRCRLASGISRLNYIAKLALKNPAMYAPREPQLHVLLGAYAELVGAPLLAIDQYSAARSIARDPFVSSYATALIGRVNLHRYSLEKAKAVKAALAAADESGASGEERAAAVAAAEERVLKYRTRAMTALDAVEAALDAAGGSGDAPSGLSPALSTVYVLARARSCLEAPGGAQIDDARGWIDRLPSAAMMGAEAADGEPEPTLALETAMVAGVLGDVALGRGDAATAQRLLPEAFRVASSLSYAPLQIRVMRSIARMYRDGDDTGSSLSFEEKLAKKEVEFQGRVDKATSSEWHRLVRWTVPLSGNDGGGGSSSTSPRKTSKKKSAKKATTPTDKKKKKKGAKE